MKSLSIKIKPRLCLDIIPRNQAELDLLDAFFNSADLLDRTNLLAEMDYSERKRQLIMSIIAKHFNVGQVCNVCKTRILSDSKKILCDDCDYLCNDLFGDNHHKERVACELFNRAGIFVGLP